MQLSTAQAIDNVDRQTADVNLGSVEIVAGDGTTVLGSKTLTGDSWADAAIVGSGGSAEAVAAADLASVSPIPITVTGVAATFRVKDAGGEVRWDGTVGTSGTDMIVPSTSLTAGTNLAIAQWNVAQACPIGV